MKSTRISHDLKEKFERTRSTGSYESLYAITLDPVVKRKLVQSCFQEKDKLYRCCDLFYDLLELYGYDRGTTALETQRHWSGYDKLAWSLACYVWVYGVDSWVEYFKWKITAFFASVFNPRNIPRKPRDLSCFDNPRQLLFGRARRFVLRMSTETLRSFANDVLMLKKGCPAVSEEMVHAKKLEVFLQLTTAPVEDPQVMGDRHAVKCPQTFEIENELVINPDTLQVQTQKKKITLSEHGLCHAIDSVVEEVFSDKVLTEEFLTSYAFPSTSSDYNNSRGEGGGVAEVTHFLRDLRKIVLEEYLTSDDFHGYDFFGPIISDFVLTPANLSLAGRIRQQRCEFADEEGNTSEGFFFIYEDKDLKDIYNFAYRRIVNAALVEEPLTETVGLPEPLKVRVITKGPPLTYFALKSVQKFLWRTLKAHPTFQLIGEPLTEDIVNEVFKDQIGQYVLSGDYKASTDNIYSWISGYTCSKVFDTIGYEGDMELFTSIRTLTRRALIEHLILKPQTQEEVALQKERAKKNGEIYRRPIEPQKQGQLMGSVVSFPFLCIINAAVCRWAMNIDSPIHRTMRLKDLPLRINGDDCVFTGSRYLEEIWEKCIPYVGFSSSVGKTYFVTDLLVMNSQTYFLVEGRWVYQPYVNFGLLHAQDKSGCSQRNPFNYASIQNDLLQKSPKAYLDKINKMFFRNHLHLFKETRLPFYMPQWAGGLGLKPPPDHCTYTDRLQLTKRIKSGEKFQLPPVEKPWGMDERIRENLSEIIAISQTYSRFMQTQDAIFDLEDKSYYNCMLVQMLLKDSIRKYYLKLRCPNNPRTCSTVYQCMGRPCPCWKTYFYGQTREQALAAGVDPEDLGPDYWHEKGRLTKYIEKVRRKWSEKLDVDSCRVRSWEELFERLDPKKYITLMIKSSI